MRRIAPEVGLEPDSGRRGCSAADGRQASSRRLDPIDVHDLDEEDSP
jgi:hypothetical protein